MMDYCSKEYRFWQKAYIPIIWFVYRDTGRLMTVISNQIFKNIEEIKSYQKGMTEILAKKEGCEVTGINVFEIGLKKLIKNKKEYWTKIPRSQKFEIGAYEGLMGWIGKFLKSPKLYDILVVVRGETAGEPVFDLGKIFFLKSSDNMKKIEEFMYFSDQVVDPRSMHSGLYDVKGVFNLSLKTGKLYRTKIPKIDENELMD